MPKIIDIPDFMEVEISGEKYNFLQNIFLLIKSRILITIYKFTNGSLFCALFNLFYKKNGKIFFKNNFYFKKINNEYFYFPNKRITRVAVDHIKHFDNLYKTYCIDSLTLNSGDLVVDCGANVGELELALKIKNKKINYIAFEPDINSFKCLEKNIGNKNNAFNFALSNKDGEDILYIDSDGGNTSLSDFGTSNQIKIETKKLDSLNLKNIKLLKIDAEGYEPEVINGCINTFSEINYISIDYGNERGVKEESTLVSVLNILYENNFKLIKESNIRKVGLFKNENIN